MADKEERIRGELRIQINQFLWPDCKECGGKCKTEEVIKFCKDSQPGITKQDAIERMAKGLHLFEWEHNKNIPQWTELNNDIQDDYKNMAKAAINALLEGVKK